MLSDDRPAVARGLHSFDFMPLAKHFQIGGKGPKPIPPCALAAPLLSKGTL
jgi:hypothetical protein